ncbi:Ig-like domain-containing protein [Deinococcus alpinitundrae]|uniref:Ig-like domain-containing protein n=1 Tax=Deinococcus alpinitundrae TaxID=468913 RepID=UPI00137AD974|nr:Ig-like domain-containing protein [Deinococcus alpinitundrae]
MNRTLIGAALILSLSLAACSASTPPVVIPDPIVDPVPQADFNFTLTPAVVSLQADGTAELSATVQRSGSFTGAVTLTLLNPPAGLNAAAVTLPAGTTNAKLNLQASSASVPGDDTLTFVADAGNLHKTVQVKVKVSAAPVPVGQAALTLVATPESLKLKAGQPTSLTVKVTRSNFTGPVKLHLSNLPANVTAPDVVLDAGQDSAEMTLTQTGKTPAGSTTVQLQVTSDTVKSSLNLPLTVESAESLPSAPTVSATSPASNAQAVNSAGLSVNVTFSQGMKSDVAKAISITPNVPNFACMVNDGSVEIQQVSCTGNFQPGVTYTVTVATTAQNTAGVGLAQPYSFSFKTAAQANPDPLPQSLMLSSAPGSLTVKVGSPVSLTVKVQRTNVSGPVTLHATNLPINVTASDVTIPDGQDSGIMTLTQTGNSPVGTSTIQVLATSGNVSASLNVPLTVQNVTNPLTVLSTTPANGAQNVPYGPNVFEVKFSQVIQEVDGVAQTVSVTPAVNKLHCFVKRDAMNKPLDGLQCTGDFDPNTTYSVTLGTGIKATDGTPLAQPYTFSFQTAPAIILPPFGDLVPPKVTGFTPTNGTLGVNHSPLSITVNFNEAMDKAATQKAFQLIVPNVTDSKKSFIWNAAGTVMTMTYNEVLPYGSTVFWGMSNTATDVAGNPLAQASSVGGSYRLVRQKSIKVYSDGSLDFSATNSKNNKYEDTVIYTEYTGKSFYQRAFVSFELNNIPELSNIKVIESASLHVYQKGFLCDGGNGAYQRMGSVIAENVSYLSTEFAFFNSYFSTPPISTGASSTLSTDATLGFKSMDVTSQVGFDVQNRGTLMNRSQWRLRFPTDSTLNNDNCSSIGWYSGKALLFQRPYLDVTYVYP